jgi:hypothetical protein
MDLVVAEALTRPLLDVQSCDVPGVPIPGRDNLYKYMSIVIREVSDVERAAASLGKEVGRFAG